jgi:hypothetical protein
MQVLIAFFFRNSRPIVRLVLVLRRVRIVRAVRAGRGPTDLTPRRGGPVGAWAGTRSQAEGNDRSAANRMRQH